MKDIKYIIKRIIIGVGIALVLMFLKGNLALQVKANSISPYQWGGATYNISSATSSYNYFVSALPGGGQPWTNHENGILRFNLSINKTSGSSTEPFPIPRTIVAVSGTRRFVCSFGSTQWQNSTFVGVTYSVECPMNLFGGQGVDAVQIAFNSFQSTANDSYTMVISSDASYEVYEGTSVNVTMDTSSTTNAINDQTTIITDNQDQNTQDIIESNQVCNIIDKNSILIEDKYLNSQGNFISSSSTFGITDFINVYSSTVTIFDPVATNPNVCFYNVNKVVLSCYAYGQLSSSQLVLPTNTYYARFSIQVSSNKPQFKICRNGNQAIADGQQQINDTLNNDNVDGASDVAESFFDNFQSDSHGLSGIITAPLRLVQSLSSSTCSALTFPLPFVNQNVSLPCMSTIYSTYFPSFLSLYRLITTGLIGYWVLIKLFGHVKGMQDPTDDKIEVMQL